MELAGKLEMINRERQQLLKASAENAIAKVRSAEGDVRRLLVISDESYEEGIIGLIAGKLVETFYRPTIVLSLRESISKASVRSIRGFNIIEFLRLHEEHFVSLGGHPMAAGFSVETTKLAMLQELLETKAETLVTEDLLQRILKIDCELPFAALNRDLYDSLQQLAPFGMNNPEPVFATKNVTLTNFRVLGKEGNHLKLVLKQETGDTFDAIAFGMGELGTKLSVGDKIDLAYSLDENTWNGETKLQLKVKDIH
jgi:single-stranded-DNA-specific exonuclease